MAEMESKQKAEILYIDLLGSISMQQAIENISQAVYAKYGQTNKGITVAFRELFGKIGAELSFDPYNGMAKLSLGIRDVQQVAQSLLVLFCKKEIS